VHWKKQSPAVSSSRINFYYQPSMDEIASMLASSPESFDFEYVKQINSEQQYRLLEHFETVYDCYSKARNNIDHLLGTIEFSTRAKCQFIIGGERYEKFKTVTVNRISDTHDLLKLQLDYSEYKNSIDNIIRQVLLSNGQGTKIQAAVKKSSTIKQLFQANADLAIEMFENSPHMDYDPVVLARNISKTGVALSTHSYNTLSSYITMSVLTDDLAVRTKTANLHMSKIKRNATQ